MTFAIRWMSTAKHTYSLPPHVRRQRNRSGEFCGRRTMKIVGQSTVANGTPYLHLGYLASTVLKPQASLLSGGQILLAAGIVVVSVATLRWVRSNLAVVALIRRKGVTLAVTGAALILAGGISMRAAFKYAKEVYVSPEYTTMKNAGGILAAMEACRQRGELIPGNMIVVKTSLGLPITDGWLNEMRLVKEVRDGKEVIFVVSAGPDEKFGTADDMRLEWIPAATRPSASRPAE
ncbi:MAG: hypothetical protein ACHRHE_17280 [Tepidisphaerales bacterium]